MPLLYLNETQNIIATSEYKDKLGKATIQTSGFVKPEHISEVHSNGNNEIVQLRLKVVFIVVEQQNSYKANCVTSKRDRQIHKKISTNNNKR